MTDWRGIFSAENERYTAWRRDFHAHPELAYEEHRTAGLVAERLRAFGIEVTEGVGKTGVVGTLVGRGGLGGSVGLRADMDALPMQEENTFGHRSTTDGVFHGCGHDGHVTMLLAAAEQLAKNPDFTGTVHFIFQPAEEGLAGGKAMVDDGLFERFPCDHVFGLHNWPDLPEGVIAARPGPVMAAADKWNIEITGTGGHAAFPHQSRDPIPVAAQVIMAFQTLIARRISPLENGVVSVTQVHGGSAFNVTPDVVTLNGTARSLSEEVRDLIEREMDVLLQGICTAHGVRGVLNYERGYPVTFNDNNSTIIALEAASRVVGQVNVRSDCAPSMGGEDFAYLLQACPGTYLWLGQGGSGLSCGLHNTRYDFNDGVIPVGAALHVELVRAALATR